MKEDPSNLSMLELFRVEAENQIALLTTGLLELERGPASAAQLESLMRAAHSLKGAARIVNLPAAAGVAHAMEDCFVAAQQGRLELRQPYTDLLLRGVDLLANISKHAEKDLPSWEAENRPRIEDFVNSVARLRSAAVTVTEPSRSVAQPVTLPASTTRAHEPPDRVLRLTAENLNRLLGLAGESLVESRWLRPFSESMQRLKRMQTELERMLEGLRQSLDGEQLSESSRARVKELFEQSVETRQFLGERLQELDLFDRRSGHLSNRLYLEVLRTRMRPFGDGTRRFPRMVRDLARSLGKEARLEITGENTQVDRDILDRLETPLAHLLRNAVDHGCELPAERVRAGKSPEGTIRVEARHSAGMLLVVVSDDGAGLDLERVRRAVVDRKLTSPALAERMSEAELLQFLFLPGFSMKDSVTELSGRGVGLDIVQNMVKGVRGSVRVSLNPMPAGEEQGAGSREQGTPHSLPPASGWGMRFQLQLPLTVSVLRTLLVEVGGEPYAFPLAQVAQTLRLPRERIEWLEGREYFRLPGTGGEMKSREQGAGRREGGGQPNKDHQTSPISHLPSSAPSGVPGVSGPWSSGPISSLGGPDLSVAYVGLLAAEEVFGVEANRDYKTTGQPDQGAPVVSGPWSSGPISAAGSLVSIVVLGDHGTRYGLRVDRFLGERELVVQPLDARLGKVKDISAAALMEDGSPVLIVDVDDLLRSIDRLVQEPGAGQRGGHSALRTPHSALPAPCSLPPKRVLAVDDSLTVRELERKLLAGCGYAVEVAQDGREAWNMLKAGGVEEGGGLGAGSAELGTGKSPALLPAPCSLLPYDLVITDVDMPRMDGIELVRLIRADPELKGLPVMVVSYKDREADRLRGLEAGADYYLTKGSFEDETLLEAVADLIGEPDA